MQAAAVRESMDRPERTTAVMAEAVAVPGSYTRLRVGYQKRILRSGDDGEVQVESICSKGLFGGGREKKGEAEGTDRAHTRGVWVT